MSIARRTLLTATAAGTVLCALWFVPSANATDGTAVQNTSAHSARSHQVSTAQEDATVTALADSGTGFDTTPYLVGGSAFLLASAGFVGYSVHRGTPLTEF